MIITAKYCYSFHAIFYANFVDIEPKKRFYPFKYVIEIYINHVQIEIYWSFDTENKHNLILNSCGR